MGKLTTTTLPPDLARLMETFFAIKVERQEAARELQIAEEMARYREDERARRYGPGNVRSAGATTGIVTEFTEIQ